MSVGRTKGFSLQSPARTAAAETGGPPSSIPSVLVVRTEAHDNGMKEGEEEG